MENTYRGFKKGLTITGHADSIGEFIINQAGFNLIGIHEVELVDGEWQRKEN